MIWCLYGQPSDASAHEKLFMTSWHAECEAEIQRMAVKNPDGIRATVQKAESEEYRKLVMLIQHANETAKQYLLGKCGLDTLVAAFNEHQLAAGSWSKVNYECINHLRAIGETTFYRRALVLQLLKGALGYFREYLVSEETVEI